ncbi:MAG TPA: SIMPL domain-containing protein [Vicinamibacterales bacterium]|nr:SIMPL domain-containing protein [Vicinamibacterales bacterium]
MHRAAGLLVVVVLTGAPDAGAQDAAQAPAFQVPTIVTSGQAIVRRAPDQAFVAVAVETRGRTPREAQQQNAEAMTSVRQRIARANVASDAVRTTGYSIQQEFDNANGRRTPRGYVARNGVEVRLDEVERVGELLDAMVDAGATTVSGVRFDLKDRGAAEREALRLAVADARARADAIAAGAGRSVDRVLRITDTQQPMFRMGESAVLQRSAVASAETPVEAGTIEIRAQVELTAAIR